MLFIECVGEGSTLFFFPSPIDVAMRSVHISEQPRERIKSMSLKYEPSSEPLHISAK